MADEWTVIDLGTAEELGLRIPRTHDAPPYPPPLPPDVPRASSYANTGLPGANIRDLLRTVPGIGPLIGAAEVTGADEIIGDTAASWGDKIAAYFTRGVIIILGFIFLAVGLSMFRSTAPIIIEAAARETKKLARRTALKK